jgi:hypothetical protein
MTNKTVCVDTGSALAFVRWTEYTPRPAGMAGVINLKRKMLQSGMDGCKFRLEQR